MNLRREGESLVKNKMKGKQVFHQIGIDLNNHGQEFGEWKYWMNDS